MVKEAPPEDCRYRRKPGGRWMPGRFIRRNEDGSVELCDIHTGSVRTIFPARVEFRSVGGRGGLVWVSAEEVERPMAPE